MQPLHACAGRGVSWRARATFLAALLVCVPAPLRLDELHELKAFYNLTNGASWTTNTNWDLGADSQCGHVDQSIPAGWPYEAPAVPQSTSPGCIYKDPCSWNTKWHGVGCIDPCYAPTDGDNCAFGRVTMLDLRQNNVEGTIPANLLDTLINITLLDLSYNSMSGTIPTQVGKIRNLRRLNLRNNHLDGPVPTEIANLGYALGYQDGEGTTHIDLAHNNLTGTVPSEIGYLEGIKHLDVSSNVRFGVPVSDNPNVALNAPLPTEIGLLTNMKVLNLDMSAFEGTIPTQVGELSLLQNIFARGKFKPHDANHNKISGTLPTQIGRLKKLHTLALSHNFISGTIPPQIGGMDILRSMQLEENKLSGSMPDVFEGLRHIEYWDTYGNSLEGDLPASIMNASTLDHLYVQLEQTGPLRNFRCRQRLPGVGSVRNDLNIPSSQAGAKYNWVLQAADYFNMVFTTHCDEPYDTDFTFNALSGDV